MSLPSQKTEGDTSAECLKTGAMCSPASRGACDTESGTLVLRRRALARLCKEKTKGSNGVCTVWFLQVLARPPKMASCLPPMDKVWSLVPD